MRALESAAMTGITRVESVTVLGVSMADMSVLAAAVVGVLLGLASLGVGYVVSRYQHRKLISAARQILRPFEKISLRDEYYVTALLATKIVEHSFTPDLIIAITPGGAMVGEWLSRRFLGDKANPIPMGTVWMHIERDAEGRHVSAPTAIGLITPSSPDEAKNVLVVNDISRSGRTLEEAVNFVKDSLGESVVMTAVLFVSQEASGPVQPDFWVDRTPRRLDFEWKHAP